MIYCLLDAISELLESSIGADKATDGQLGEPPNDGLAYLSLSNLQKLFQLSSEKTRGTILNLDESE